MVLEINDQQFEELSSSNKTFLVEFYATWCGPCKMMFLVMEKLSEKIDIPFTKIEAEKYETLSTKFSITSLPCFILIKNGQEVARLTGYISAENLEKEVNKHLSE